MSRKQPEDKWDDPIFHDAILVDHKARYVKKEKHYLQQVEDSCIICKIIKKNQEVDRYEIYRNNDIIIFLNLYPYQVGHVMISPIKHLIGFEEFSSELILEMGLLTQKTLQVLKHYGNASSFNVGWNQGEVAGGSIKHFHIHIVPRYKNELNFMEIIARTKPFIQSLEDVEAGLQKYQAFFAGEVNSIEELFSE